MERSYTTVDMTEDTQHAIHLDKEEKKIVIVGDELALNVTKYLNLSLPGFTTSGHKLRNGEKRRFLYIATLPAPEVPPTSPRGWKIKGSKTTFFSPLGNTGATRKVLADFAHSQHRPITIRVGIIILSRSPYPNQGGALEKRIG
nr:unnamed protein product [Callosobruchus analis]